MPTANTLTDAICKRAAPSDKPQKLFDGHGLHLFITPAGGKRWRMSYRFGGKPQTATFGPYPRVSLADARKRRDDLMQALDRGEDPKAKKEPKKPADVLTFQTACENFWRGRKDITSGYRDNALRGLEMHLWPTLGELPITEIDKPALMKALLRMDDAGKHVYVRRVRVWAGQVFDWAVERGEAKMNPAALIRPDKAFAKRPVENFAALDITEVPAFMERLSLEKELQSVLACKLLALTWVRTKELRAMEWDQVDGDMWRVPAGNMKKRRAHLVPLSSQALKLLEVLRARRRPASPYVFPSEHRDDRPMSENAVLYLIARMGYQGRMTGHGWRSVGSTWANEREMNPDAIERQLSHAPDDEVRGVYNRAEYLAQRRAILQGWADWLMPDPAAAA